MWKNHLYHNHSPFSTVPTKHLLEILYCNAPTWYFVNQSRHLETRQIICRNGQDDMAGYGLSNSTHTSETNVPNAGNTDTGRWYEIFRRGWTFEVLSSVFSLVSFLAMIILLSRIHATPLSSWAASVSPNAMIAVLSTASRASLILPVTESLSQLKWLHLAAKRER